MGHLYGHFSIFDSRLTRKFCMLTNDQVQFLTDFAVQRDNRPPNLTPADSRTVILVSPSKALMVMEDWSSLLRMRVYVFRYMFLPRK